MKETTGEQRHESDLTTVLDCAFQHNVDKIIIACGTLNEARRGLELSRANPNLFFTVCVHPIRCKSEFGSMEGDNEEGNRKGWDEYLAKMRSLVEEGAVSRSAVAIGELGLDYARLEL